MTISIYAFAVFAFVTIYYWKIIYEALRERYRLIHYVGKMPGPLALPLVGTIWQMKMNINELTKQMQSWTRYYSLRGESFVKFWVGPHAFVTIIRPEAAKVLLESNVVITKASEYDILVPWLGTGLLISTGAKWQVRRKMLTPSFHFNVLNEFMKIHDYEARIFTEEIEEFAVSGETFDIFPWVKRCALDIICETAMGCSVSAQTNHNHPYVLSVQRMNELAFTYQRMPWLHFKPIWYASGVGFEYDSHLKTVTEFTRKVIDNKLAEQEGGNEGERKVFLDMLIELSREGKLSYEDIREEVDTFMFEGHDTTAASMGWTIWCLSHYPKYQDKIHEELQSIFNDSDRDCTSEDIKHMKYLEKCIKESLRLRPSVPNFARKVEEDFEIEGTIIPKGSSVIISTYSMHRNPTVFENPDVFDPERFSEENISKRHPYAYIPFSAGPRNCIGQKFAIMEEKTLLSWFFRKYKVSSDVGLHDNLALPEIILRPHLGVPVKIHKK